MGNKPQPRFFIPAQMMWIFFIVLFVMKMGIGHTDVATWPWWWVTAPVWAPLALSGVLMLLAVIGEGILAMVERFEKKP